MPCWDRSLWPSRRSPPTRTGSIPLICPRYLADGSQAVYTITEQPVAGYEAEYAPPVTDADGNVTQNITNHAVSGAACYTLTLTKQIAGDTPATPETFTFTLTPDDPGKPHARRYTKRQRIGADHRRRAGIL